MLEGETLNDKSKTFTPEGDFFRTEWEHQQN